MKVLNITGNIVTGDTKEDKALSVLKFIEQLHLGGLAVDGISYAAVYGFLDGTVKMAIARDSKYLKLWGDTHAHELAEYEIFEVATRQ